MRKTFTLFVIIFSATLSAFSQQKTLPGSYLPQPTPEGAGKIDNRIDNMGYWQKMADSGFVFVAPADNIPNPTYTGSRIEDPMVMTTNSTDVLTTGQNSTQSENSVFVRPADSSDLINSNNSTPNPASGIYGADYLLSTDGGATWGGAITGAGGSNSGDPAAAISLDDRYYIGFINSTGGQSVSFSTNAGSTWTPVVAGVLPTGGSLLDKNHLWIDNSDTSPYEGNLYDAWTCFGGANNAEIEIARSTNGGLNWSAQVPISTVVNAGSHNQGVNIQTGPNGEVYVAWAIYDGWPADESAIGFARSMDGGATFGPSSRIISNIRGIRTTQTLKSHRVNSFPVMAVDISGGVNNGNIYIVWSNIGFPGVNSGTGIDVYMIKSTNGGTSWSAPLRVNQDPAGQGKQHYFPWISCDPVTGDLCVVFYDDRNVSSSECEVFVAYSFDAGDNWADFKVSDVAFTPVPIPGLAGGYMGDYLGIASRGGRVYPTWGDNRTGTVMTYVSPFELTKLPLASFTASTTTPCLNDTVLFQDISVKNPLTWNWSITPATHTFVNGTTATTRHPMVRFEAYGNYSVQLIVTNTFGADTLLKNNYIGVNFANADFTVNHPRIVVNNTATFTDQSTCNVSSYAWNFGTGASPASAGTIGPHTVTYNSTGFKTVSLTVNGNVTTTKNDYIEVISNSINMANGSVTMCEGTFFDSHGTSNYTDNENYTLTFYPADTSKSMRAIFTLFDIEAVAGCGYDFLKIYDGINTSAPLMGTYCGTDSPDTVIALNATGALTFQFHSDVSVVGPGWQASLGCIDTPPLPPPSYCEATTDYCDEYISHVVLGMIDNASGCTGGGYHDYTALSTRVSPGVNYSVTVTNGSLAFPQDKCGIWVDWNRDYDFSDEGETLSVSGSPGIGPYSAGIVPPANAVKGFTRLRTRIIYEGTLSPCGSSSFGEVEDYSLYVGTHGLWIGGVAGAENEWSNPGNWDDGLVPAAGADVTIPEGVEDYPEISGTVSCIDMDIKDGAAISVEPGAVLNVNGNCVIGEGSSGILTINGGVCNVSGNITVSEGSTINVINGGILNDND